MHTLLIALTLSSPSFAAPVDWNGVVTASQEVSVGRVLHVNPATSTVTLQERRGGLVFDDVVIRDETILDALVPGETVLIYREACGTMVIPAR